MELVAYLAREWVVISTAPFTFVTGAGLVAAMAYAVLRVQFQDRLRSMEARIALRDDRIADYERKLDGASPEAAKSRLEALEARVAGLSAELKGLGEVDYVRVFEEGLK